MWLKAYASTSSSTWHGIYEYIFLSPVKVLRYYKSKGKDMSRFIQILRHGFATYASTGKRCGLEVYSRVAGAQKLKGDSEKIYAHVST